MAFVFADPTEWWIEIPPSVQTEAWQQSQQHTTPSRRWNAYLNQICLNTCLSWIENDYFPGATACFDFNALSAIHEFVNGTAVTVGTKRIVLVPTETIDDGELEVPQEWVDIPSWSADYYLAVQVKADEQSDEQWLRVWGYTTHQKLKTFGRYDSSDRTYCMDERNLTQDMNVLWVTQQFSPDEQTKTVLEPLPELTTIQAENLIQRLGNRTIAFPRLAVPFTFWGALLEREEWRQHLYEQRTGQNKTQTVPLPVQLGQWLQNQFEIGWQPVEALLHSTSGSLASGFRRSAASTSESEITQLKLIDLESSSVDQEIALLIGLRAEADEKVGIRVQVYSTSDSTYVPPDLILSLLSGTGEVLQSVQAQSQDNYIQFKFRCPSETAFSLQITIDDFSTTENFVI